VRKAGGVLVGRQSLPVEGPLVEPKSWVVIAGLDRGHKPDPAALLSGGPARQGAPDFGARGQQDDAFDGVSVCRGHLFGAHDDTLDLNSAFWDANPRLSKSGALSHALLKLSHALLGLGVQLEGKVNLLAREKAIAVELGVHVAEDIDSPGYAGEDRFVFKLFGFLDAKPERGGDGVASFRVEVRHPARGAAGHCGVLGSHDES
jgi:hypothetical protein